MPRNVKALLIILFFISMFSYSSYAYRELSMVEPVVHNGIKYTANIATIEAWDNELNIKLWELKVYDPEEFYWEYISKDSKKDSQYEPEWDNEWNCIVSLKIEGEKLIVTNEAGGEYEVDLQNKKVTKLKEEVKPSASPAPK